MRIHYVNIRICSVRILIFVQHVPETLFCYQKHFTIVTVVTNFHETEYYFDIGFEQLTS